MRLAPRTLSLTLALGSLAAAAFAAAPAVAADAPATRPAAVDLKDPRSAAMAFGTALVRGDADAALAAATGPEDRQNLVRAFAPVMKAVRAMSDEAAAAFGPENPLSKQAAGTTVAVDLEGFDLKVEGDTATFTPRDAARGRRALRLLRKGDAWKVDLEQLPAEQMDFALQMAPAIIEAAKTVGDQIKADKAKPEGQKTYANGAAAQEAFTGKVMEALLRSPAPATKPGK